MSGHSIIPPSSAKIWGAPGGCRGWALKNATLPEEPESEASRDGTAVHDIARGMIERSVAAATLQGYEATAVKVVGREFDGVVATAEMYSAAEMYAEECVKVMHRTGVLRGDHVGIEQTLRAPSVHELSGGTPDFFLYDQKTGHLYVIDLKYGFGIVEAFENWQLLNYAAAVSDTLGVTISEVTLTIVQPRAYHSMGPVRSWKITSVELREYQSKLSRGAEESLSGTAPCTSGEHCRYCRLRFGCHAAVAAAMSIYECSVLGGEINTAADLGVQLSLVRRAIKHLECVESGIEGELTHRIRSGENAGAWSLKESKGREEWTLDTDTLLEFAAMSGLDLSKPGVITPNQARAAGMPADLVATLTERKSSLRLENDKGNNARMIFSK